MAWSPADLGSTLKLWGSADVPGGSFSNGDFPTVIADRAGGPDMKALAIGGIGPAPMEYRTNYLNGKPGLRSSASGSTFLATDLQATPFVGGTEMTFFMVARRRTASSGDGMAVLSNGTMADWNNADNILLGFHASGTSFADYRDTVSRPNDVFVDFDATNEAFIYITAWRTDAVVNSGRFHIRSINGRLDPDPFNDSEGGDQPFNAKQFLMGGRYDASVPAPSNFFLGDYFEWGVCDTQLSEPTIALLSDYLAEKWIEPAGDNSGYMEASSVPGIVVPGSFLPGTSDGSHAEPTPRDDFEAVVSALSPAIWHRLDETSGTTAADSSGNGRDGTYAGGVALNQAGALIANQGSAAGFNGMSSWVDGVDGYDPISGGAADTFTIAAWIRMGPNGGAPGTVAAGLGKTTDDWFGAFTFGAAGVPRFRISGPFGYDTSVIAPNDMRDGQWHFYVGVREGFSSHKLYIDGVLVDTSTDFTHAGTYDRFAIGILDRTTTNFGTAFRGDVDEAMVFDYALTLADVQAIYDAATMAQTGGADSDVSPPSIASAEAFGSAHVGGDTLYETSGILGRSALGSFVLGRYVVPAAPSGGLSVLAAGIASAEAFGTHTVSMGAVSVQPSGVASSESWGSATVAPGAVSAQPAGIASGEAWGAVSVGVGPASVQPSGIASGESWGTSSVSGGAVSLQPHTVASSEAWGTAAVTAGAVQIAPSGIASGEGFGTSTILAGTAILPTSVASGESFGSAALSVGPVSVAPASVGSAESFGAAQVATNVAPSAIPSGEAFGVPTAVRDLAFAPVSIVSGESFGTPALSVGPATVLAPFVPSAEAFGQPAAQPGPVSVSPSGIGSSESWGAPAAAAFTGVAVSSIPSAEAFGIAALATGPVAVLAPFIPSAGTFGSPLVIRGPAPGSFVPLATLDIGPAVIADMKLW
jgi:hypothetical protein